MTSWSWTQFRLNAINAVAMMTVVYLGAMLVASLWK
jgi:hypothetical protein